MMVTIYSGSREKLIITVTGDGTPALSGMIDIILAVDSGLTTYALTETSSTATQWVGERAWAGSTPAVGAHRCWVVFRAGGNYYRTEPFDLYVVE